MPFIAKIEDFYKDTTDLVITQEQGGAWAKDPSIPHNGVDVSAGKVIDGKWVNTYKFREIVAGIRGRITRVSYHFESENAAFGNRISIAFDNKRELYIAHNDGFSPLLRCGMLIDKGPLISRAGSTGASTDNHTHWGVRLIEPDENGKVVWLDVDDYICFDSLRRV